jgi:hypothetical protein
MTAPCSSGHCVMPAERLPGKPFWLNLAAGFLLVLPVATTLGADAPTPDIAPVPVPVEAEAAHQDLKAHDDEPKSLDEAIFTEISPLTIPEIGIALPPDQAL